MYLDEQGIERCSTLEEFKAYGVKLAAEVAAKLSLLPDHLGIVIAARLKLLPDLVFDRFEVGERTEAEFTRIWTEEVDRAFAEVMGDYYR